MRFLQAFGISDSRRWLIRGTSKMGPRANFFHVFCICIARWVKGMETTPRETRSDYTGPKVQWQSNDKHSTGPLPAELLLLPGKRKDPLLKPFLDLHFQDAIAAAQPLAKHGPGSSAQSQLTFSVLWNPSLAEGRVAKDPSNRSNRGGPHSLWQDLSTYFQWDKVHWVVC